VFCLRQNVTNGTDKVRSQETVAALWVFFFALEGIKEPLLDVLYLSLSQKSHGYVFGARSGRKFLSGLATRQGFQHICRNFIFNGKIKKKFK
jgi:hypothetical protein